MIKKLYLVMLFLTLSWGNYAGIEKLSKGPIVVDGGVIFRHFSPNASSVYIAGDFNNWTPNIKLNKISAEGGFQVFVPLLLKEKKYRYKLIVDGIWQKDPANSLSEYDLSGDDVSYFIVPKLMIHYGINPMKVGKNLFRFNYKNSHAATVYLVGSFNNFNPYDIQMKKDINGIWSCQVQVFPGKQYYNFIVDGNWVIDPSRIKNVHNRFGRKFSIFTAE